MQINHLTSIDFFLWGDPQAVGQDVTDLTTPLFVDEEAVYTAAGSGYSLIVLSDGQAMSAGYIESLNMYQGHLGLDSQDVVQGVNSFRLVEKVYDADSLSFISPLFDKVFAGVENTPNSGIVHSILLDRQGRAWAVGSNKRGQLCLGDGKNRMIPEKIPTSVRIVDVALGGAHTLLLDEFGNVHSCGSNDVGQLGLGKDVVDSQVPKTIEGLERVTSISTGHSHSLFTTQDSTYFVGSNEFGQLCISEKENVFTPRALDTSQKSVLSFEAIRESSFILYKDGLVAGCGRNDFGQLGDGTNQDKIIAPVDLNGRATRLLGIGPSSQSVFFVTNDEFVWGTGLNNRGQLGTGDQENRNSPSRVKFRATVLMDLISAAEFHTLALGGVSGNTPLPTNASPELTLAPSKRPAFTSPTAPPTDFETDLTPVPNILAAVPTKSPTCKSIQKVLYCHIL